MSGLIPFGDKGATCEGGVCEIPNASTAEGAAAQADKGHAMDLRFDHLHIYSGDPDAAAAFYCNSLGAERLGEATTANGLRVVLNMAGTRLYIEQAPAGRLGMDHMAFRTDDLDAAIAGIVTSGGRVLIAPREAGPGLRIAFVETPDQGRIEILERK